MRGLVDGLGRVMGDGGAGRDDVTQIDRAAAGEMPAVEAVQLHEVGVPAAGAGGGVEGVGGDGGAMLRDGLKERQAGRVTAEISQGDFRHAFGERAGFYEMARCRRQPGEQGGHREVSAPGGLEGGDDGSQVGPGGDGLDFVDDDDGAPLLGGHMLAEGDEGRLYRRRWLVAGLGCDLARDHAEVDTDGRFGLVSTGTTSSAGGGVDDCGINVDGQPQGPQGMSNLARPVTR